MEEFDKKIIVAHYEEVVCEPIEWCRKLEDFLGIKCVVPEEILDMGYQWKGNSSYGEELVGIRNTQVERWKNEAKPLIAHIENEVKKELELAGYEFNCSAIERAVLGRFDGVARRVLNKLKSN